MGYLWKCQLGHCTQESAARRAAGVLNERHHWADGMDCTRTWQKQDQDEFRGDGQLSVTAWGRVQTVPGLQWLNLGFFYFPMMQESYALSRIRILMSDLFLGWKCVQQQQAAAPSLAHDQEGEDSECVAYCIAQL